MAKQISAEEAANLIKDEMTVIVGGFGAYSGPDLLLQAIAERYSKTRHPSDLTVVSGISPGNFRLENGTGLSLLHEDGLISSIISAHLGNAPVIAEMAGNEKIAAYLLPLGVLMQLLRAIAGRRPGIITRIGLGTYADPRVEGCRVNNSARALEREVVSLVEREGEEYLFYKSFPVDACVIRGTYADCSGNISIAKEGMNSSQLQMAAAVHNNGGTVIVQVEEVVQDGFIPARQVCIPGSIVDYYVKADPCYQKQYYAIDRYHGELTGEYRCPTEEIMPLPLNVKKVIARRAAEELMDNAVINLGIGIPSGIGNVANEEGMDKGLLLSLESGLFGGVPLAGDGFGGAANPEAMICIADNFDLIDGGFLNQSFLGAAEVDQYGNVNVSRFGKRCVGPGGFIDISKNTQRIVFMLNFTSGKSEIDVKDGKLVIRKDGTGNKFVNSVSQITFSGEYAKKTGQKITYITERAVFELTMEGLCLTEIAPGVDLNRDILEKMQFAPLISSSLKIMDQRYFR